MTAMPINLKVIVCVCVCVCVLIHSHVSTYERKREGETVRIFPKFTTEGYNIYK